VEWSASRTRKAAAVCVEKQAVSWGKREAFAAALPAWRYPWACLEAKNKLFRLSVRIFMRFVIFETYLGETSVPAVSEVPSGIVYVGFASKSFGHVHLLVHSDKNCMYYL
jgi:hypothetical protein